MDEQKQVATKEKVGLLKRIRKSIFVGNKGDLKESFINDILFPTIRDFIADALYNAVDVALFGRDSSGEYRYRGRRRYGSSRTASRFYDDSPDRMSAIDKADDVRAALLEELYKSGKVTVYDFYDEAELTGEFTDQEWGWRSFGPNNDIGFLPTADGVSLILPEPEYLGR